MTEEINRCTLCSKKLKSKFYVCNYDDSVFCSRECFELYRAMCDNEGILNYRKVE